MPKLKFRTIIPTPEADAQIAAGIAADPDTYEVPSHEFAQMRLLRGRPPVARPKAALTMRVAPHVAALHRRNAPMSADPLSLWASFTESRVIPRGSSP